MQASASALIFCSPLNDERELVAAVFDELLGLVVGQGEHIDAVDLDEVVVGSAASLACDAVQRDLCGNTRLRWVPDRL